MKTFEQRNVGPLAALYGVIFAVIVLASGLYYANHAAYECQHEMRAAVLTPGSNKGNTNGLDQGAQNNQQYETCAWGHNAEQWLAMLTAWLVLGTALLAAFTALLWVNSEESARKQRDADAEAHRRELRAYITVPEPTLRPTSNGTFVDFKVFNGGKTPAHNVRMRCQWSNIPDAILEKFIFCDCVDGETASFVIGPGETRTIVSQFFGAALAPPQTIPIAVIWGWIEYDDVFEGSPRWRTEFCFRATASPGSSGSNAAQYNVSAHSQYNGADDFCRYRPITPKGMPQSPH